MASQQNFLKYFGSKLVILLLDQSTLDTLKENSQLHKNKMSLHLYLKKEKANFFIFKKKWRLITLLGLDLDV